MKQPHRVGSSEANFFPSRVNSATWNGNWIGFFFFFLGWTKSLPSFITHPGSRSNTNHSSCYGAIGPRFSEALGGNDCLSSLWDVREDAGARYRGRIERLETLPLSPCCGMRTDIRARSWFAFLFCWGLRAQMLKHITDRSYLSLWCLVKSTKLTMSIYSHSL